MSVQTDPPSVVRRLSTASAAALADLVETFEDLQTVLRCCERLVVEQAAEGGVPDPVVVEGIWTTALVSYARCFAAGAAGARLTEDDLTASHPPGGDVLEWHQVLLQLRDHYTDPVTNPRERFSVGVAQDGEGAAAGVAITSARQPLVDDLTVRQTGAIAFTLSGLVNDRIEGRQAAVFEELRSVSRAELDKLERVDVAGPPNGS